MQCGPYYGGGGNYGGGAVGGGGGYYGGGGYGGGGGYQNNYGTINITINNYYYHLRGTDETVFSFLTVKNDLSTPLHLEIRSPGGVYYLGDVQVPSDDDRDVKLLKGTFDVILRTADDERTISSLDATEDLEISASAILRGDLSGLTTVTATVVNFGDKLSSWLTDKGMEGYGKVYLGSLDDKVDDALARLRALPPNPKEDEEIKEPEVAGTDNA